MSHHAPERRGRWWLSAALAGLLAASSACGVSADPDEPTAKPATTSTSTEPETTSTTTTSPPTTSVETFPGSQLTKVEAEAVVQRLLDGYVAHLAEMARRGEVDLGIDTAAFAEYLTVELATDQLMVWRNRGMEAFVAEHEEILVTSLEVSSVSPGCVAGTAEVSGLDTVAVNDSGVEVGGLDYFRLRNFDTGVDSSLWRIDELIGSEAEPDGWRCAEG